MHLVYGDYVEKKTNDILRTKVNTAASWSHKGPLEYNLKHVIKFNVSATSRHCGLYRYINVVYYVLLPS